MSYVTKSFALLGAAGLAIASAVAPASAEDKLDWSVNIGATSDYVFRGFSQTDEDPAVQGGADLTYGMFYAGIWASNVDQFFVGGATTEVDLYAGVTPTFADISWDFGVIYYGYPGQDDALSGGVDVDYWEFKAGASKSFGKFSAGATYYFSPEYTFEVGQTHVIEGSLGYELPKVERFTPTVDGMIGHISGEQGFVDYTYWNVGLALAVENFTMDFRYHDTDVSNDGLGQGGKNLGDERFVFSASVSLP